MTPPVALALAAAIALAACESVQPVGCLRDGDAEKASGVSAKYDRFADSVRIGYANPWKETDQMTARWSNEMTPARVMLVAFACEGTGRCTPERVTAMFMRYSPEDAPFRGAETVRFLVDEEERHSYPVDYYAPEVIGSGDSRAYEGVVGIDVPYGDFQPIVCADSVEFRIGTVVGSFTGEDLASLRTLFSEIPLDELGTKD